MELSRNTNHRRKKSETPTTACHSNTTLRKCSMDSCLILRCLSLIRASFLWSLTCIGAVDTVFTLPLFKKPSGRLFCSFLVLL